MLGGGAGEGLRRYRMARRKMSYRQTSHVYTVCCRGVGLVGRVIGANVNAKGGPPRVIDVNGTSPFSTLILGTPEGYCTDRDL